MSQSGAALSQKLQHFLQSFLDGQMRTVVGISNVFSNGKIVAIEIFTWIDFNLRLKIGVCKVEYDSKAISPISLIFLSKLGIVGFYIYKIYWFDSCINHKARNEV